MDLLLDTGVHQDTTPIMKPDHLDPKILESVAPSTETLALGFTNSNREWRSEAHWSRDGRGDAEGFVIFRYRGCLTQYGSMQANVFTRFPLYSSTLHRVEF